MKKYNVFTEEIAEKIRDNFVSKKGYITKLTSGNKPGEVIGYIARCETPIKSDPNLVTIYIQWQENNKFTMHDAKILAMDRALKIARRYEKSLEEYEFRDDFSIPTIDDVFPDIPLTYKNVFKKITSRSYEDIKDFAKMCEKRVKLFYKDKEKNILWGNSMNFNEFNLFYYFES